MLEQTPVLLDVLSLRKSYEKCIFFSRRQNQKLSVISAFLDGCLHLNHIHWNSCFLFVLLLKEALKSLKYSTQSIYIYTHKFYT